MRNSSTNIKKKTDKQWAFLALFIFSLIIFGGNDYNPDYREYEYRYVMLLNDSHIGIGYYFLEMLHKKLGCSFQLFRAMQGCIGLVLLTKTVKYYTNKPLVPFALFLFYPFLLDVVQVGNFLGYTIVLFSIRFLDEEFPKGAIKYSIGVLIASQFHILAIMYLLFLLVYIKKTKSLVLISISLTVFISASIHILPNYIPNLPIIGQHSKQINYYLTYNQSYMNGAITYAILLVSYYFIFLRKMSISRRFENSGLNETKYEILLKILALSLCFVPFIIINSEFVRLIRNIWVLFYIALYTDLNTSEKIRYKYDTVFKLFAVALSLFLFYKELSPSSYYYESVTKAIFRNNIFW